MAQFIQTLTLLLSAVLVSSDLSSIHVENGHFVDEDGRVMLFRGINSVIKHFPWYDLKMLDPARHKQMSDWGFNAVRLGSMWSGVEPEEGVVNETYIGVLKDIVAGLADNGIYSYLDMHQDVLTEVAEYAGVPTWLTAKFQPPEHPYPWPMYNTSGFSTWACGYFTQEITNGFQQLYTEHKQEFANFWRQVAERFKNDPAILGYELMNEPWTGDLYRDASLILPGNAGFELLEPFFNAASNAIREVDDETIIFWEPVTYAYFVNVEQNIIIDGVLDAFLKSHNFTDFLPILKQVCGEIVEGAGESVELSFEKELTNILVSLGEATSHRFNLVDEKTGRPSTLGPGFTAPPGGPEYLNRTAMSWHYYCWALPSYSSDQDYDPVLRAVCDDFLGSMVFDTVDARAKELGGSATMLTEFGLCSPEYDHPDYQGTIECNFILGQADQHFQSWSYWDTASGGALWDSEGEPVMESVKVFSRPYPQATAGTPVHMEFDPESRTFQYEFMPNQDIASPTEIFVPQLLFPDGIVVVVSDNLDWEEDEFAKNKILVKALDENVGFVKIFPK
eukprot:GFUD01008936.1.p1 GENE.GFUD01008936.1~~GFUD01008936.1.p1  ORF type:complete len:562 (-),score=130.38 GFUD01008936.1:42-1727(-)